jgi:hypothetical protein
LTLAALFNSFVSTRGEPFVLFEIPAWKHLREGQKAETGGRRKKKSDSFLPFPQRTNRLALLPIQLTDSLGGVSEMCVYF